MSRASLCPCATSACFSGGSCMSLRAILRPLLVANWYPSRLSASASRAVSSSPKREALGDELLEALFVHRIVAVAQRPRQHLIEEQPPHRGLDPPSCWRGGGYWWRCVQDVRIEDTHRDGGVQVNHSLLIG